MQHQNFYEDVQKILIVDDEPYNLLGLKIMLQQTIKGCFDGLMLKAEGD